MDRGSSEENFSTNFPNNNNEQAAGNRANQQSANGQGNRVDSHRSDNAFHNHNHFYNGYPPYPHGLSLDPIPVHNQSTQHSPPYHRDDRHVGVPKQPSEDIRQPSPDKNKFNRKIKIVAIVTGATCLLLTPFLLRPRIVSWIIGAARQEFTEYAWDDSSISIDEKIEKTEAVEVKFQLANFLSLRGDPTALVYKAYMKDFRSFAIRNNSCFSPSVIYGRAIEIFTSPKYEYKEHDKYILLELGHWLTNRDRDFRTAIKIYGIIPRSQTEFYRDVLLSMAIAQFHAGDLNGAKISFDDATEIDKQLRNEVDAPSFKYRFNVANLYALIAIDNKGTNVLKDEPYNYAEGEYRSLIGKHVAHNFYYAWRNLGLIYYWNGSYEDAAEILTGALAFDASTSRDIENRGLIQRYADSALAITSEQKQALSQEEKEAVEKNIRGILGGYFITHDALKDQFFLRQHNKSYGCNVI